LLPKVALKNVTKSKVSTIFSKKGS
jgi:hypothetical protein